MLISRKCKMQAVLSEWSRLHKSNQVLGLYVWVHVHISARKHLEAHRGHLWEGRGTGGGRARGKVVFARFQ